MKNYKKYQVLFPAKLLLLLIIGSSSFAQDSTTSLVLSEVAVVKKQKPVKNTFGSDLLINNQTVMVPAKGTLEMYIQHEFGVINANGSKDLWGIFAPGNIRLGLSYSPMNKLFVGAGITKERTSIDVNAKYAILEQTKGKMPVSVSFYGNVVMDAREKSNFRNTVDRFSYFSQLMVARKVTEKFSAQISGSLSWYNNVEGYVDSKGEIQAKMHNYHLAFAILGRYKVSEKSAITVDYDQPLTQHLTNNPHPNISFGYETTTSSHAFQFFAGTYGSIVPQSNNMYNQNDYTKGQFVIGFNITHLWPL